MRPYFYVVFLVYVLVLIVTLPSGLCDRNRLASSRGVTKTTSKNGTKKELYMAGKKAPLNLQAAKTKVTFITTDTKNVTKNNTKNVTKKENNSEDKRTPIPVQDVKTKVPHVTSFIKHSTKSKDKVMQVPSDSKYTTKGVTKSPTKGVTKSTTISVTKNTTKGVTKSTTKKGVTKSTTISVTKSITKSVTKSTAKGVTKSTTKGVTKSTTKGVTKSHKDSKKTSTRTTTDGEGEFQTIATDVTEKVINLGSSKGHSNSSLAENATDKNIIKITVQSPVSNLPLPLPPGVIVMFMDSEAVVLANFTLTCSSKHEQYVLRMSINQLMRHLVARIVDPTPVVISCEHMVTELNQSSQELGVQGAVTGSFNFTVTSGLLGRAVLLFFLSPVSQDVGQKNSTQNFKNADDLQANSALVSMTPQPSAAELPSVPSPSASPPAPSYKVVLLVFQKPNIISEIFRYVLYLGVVLTTIGMGCKTDLHVVKEVLKKPAAPAIGFCCQYIGMPLIAYAIAKTVPLDSPAVALGIFTCGLCPGGGVSNLYTYLLNGDISLSVTMTTISTIAAFGMIPLWLFTLGSTIKNDDVDINIPYLKIFESLVIVVLPLFVGFFLKYRCERVNKFFIKILKPISIITVIVSFSFGAYVFRYIFRLLDPITLMAGCLLPYIGYLSGGLTAFICRQPWARVKTIAIETGIQNMNVALLMLVFSLPPPDGELAAVGPGASILMTPIPLIIVTTAYLTYNKVKGRKPSQEQPEVKEAMLKSGTNGDLCNGKTQKDKKKQKNGENVEMLSAV